MKILIFCLFLSTVLHLLALGTLNLFAPSSQPEIGEVVDLTVVSPASALAPANKVPVKIAAPSPPVATSPSLQPTTASTDSTPQATEDSAGDSDNLSAEASAVGWSEVTRLPKVKREVKAQYPAEAKTAGIDGPVLLEILIDREGQVRQVKVISGPGYGLNESAVAALKNFEFQPAFKGKESVAVKIRYTYRFKLEVN